MFGKNNEWKEEMVLTLDSCLARIRDLEKDQIKNDARILALDQRKEISADLGARIAELELKMSKLWNMLIEISPTTGKEKLTKFGRKFGGKSKMS